MTQAASSSAIKPGESHISKVRSAFPLPAIAVLVCSLLLNSVSPPGLAEGASIRTAGPTEPVSRCLLPYVARPLDPTALAGLLFFDLNGSGLREHHEPAIADFTVCATTPGQAKTCVQTDETGRYRFGQAFPTEADIRLTFADPNHDDPARAFRFINLWKGPVTIEAYELNGVRVPEQHLNDTEVRPLQEGIPASVGLYQETGLMQGFLTMPFLESQVPQLYIWNFFDIIGYRKIDEGHTFWSTLDGVMLSYDGKYDSATVFPEPYDLNVPLQPGVGDSHTGLDYWVPIGNYILSGAPTSEVYGLPLDRGELRAHLMFPDPASRHENYADAYGHLSVQLVQLGQTVYRGQIVGLSGNSGPLDSYQPPQLHFDLYKATRESSYYIDVFRETVHLDPLPENYWGSDVSWWTKDNDPQFPTVEHVSQP